VTMKGSTSSLNDFTQLYMRSSNESTGNGKQQIAVDSVLWKI